MRAIAITFLLSIVPLMADFYPSTVQSTISGIGQNSITLKRGFPAKGMSAIIMHKYGDDLKAVTSYMRYDGGNRGRLIENEPILHDELPAVKPKVGVGDRVIAGYLYKNILLLAPDANTYARITSSAKKNWIHPDLYAMFLSQEGDQYPTQENLQKFANEYQIGLVYIVQRGKALLYDPISRRYVSKKTLTGLPAKGQFPFYMRLGKIESGWFSREADGEYYQLMKSIR
ncbi:MAG: plasminogen-binding N-terminal domain-containing protein [Campylobacterota bacterium]|nr:plasminogen-binding N-terminal domain-containing protein [Campylobacterota bacterium]